MDPTPVTLSLSQSTLEQHIRSQRLIAAEAATIRQHLQQSLPAYLQRLERLETHAAQTADHLQGVLDAKRAQQVGKPQAGDAPRLPPVLQRQVY
ncbi:MAG: hypothetical protein AAFV72_00140 [Cyanobacteria bacterium J06635_1]